MRRPLIVKASLLLSLIATSATSLDADEITFWFAGPDGPTIQSVIDGAQDGDVIRLAPGTYDQRFDFAGKAIRIVGFGPESIIRGTGFGPVVRFVNGEGPDSVLDSVTITGGHAVRGGAVLIRGSSPTIVRSILRENRAQSQGSAIYVAGASSPRIYNNLIVYNTRSGSGDPHAVELDGGSAALVHNTIVRNDSNGVIVNGGAPRIEGNLLAWNGSASAGRRGRGICDFSSGRAQIGYNGFHRNRIAAILRDGRDWKRVRHLERHASDPLVIGNVDGAPGFVRVPAATPSDAVFDDFGLLANAAARDSGNPECRDRDGSRADLGFTGGRFAPGSGRLPGAGTCGATAVQALRP